MRSYRNTSKQSGVESYELAEDGIIVRFTGGDTYLYTHASAGKQAVEKMKKLAEKGQGLSTFISQTVKDNYADKIEKH